MAIRLDWLPLAPGSLRSILAITTAALGTLGLACLRHDLR